MSLKNPRDTKFQRQLLRREMTSSEELLWDRVRGKQLLGLRFKRQYGLGPYILDLYVPQIKLCIEVDGGIHNLKEVKEKDKNRDAFMNENGIKVVRFRNDQIENDMEGVINFIEHEIQKKQNNSDLLCPLLLKEEDFLNSFGYISTSPSPYEGEDRWGQKGGELCNQ